MQSAFDVSRAPQTMGGWPSWVLADSISPETVHSSLCARAEAVRRAGRLVPAYAGQDRRHVHAGQRESGVPVQRGARYVSTMAPLEAASASGSQSLTRTACDAGEISRRVCFRLLPFPRAAVLTVAASFFRTAPAHSSTLPTWRSTSASKPFRCSGTASLFLDPRACHDRIPGHL